MAMAAVPKPVFSFPAAAKTQNIAAHFGQSLRLQRLKKYTGPEDLNPINRFVPTECPE